MRSTALVFVAVVLGVGGAACGPVSGSDATPETRRGPVSLAGSEVELVSATELSVTVPSCNGHPEVATLDEDNGAVQLEVVTTQVVRGPSDGCLDAVRVVLDAPLGDRALVDNVSGEALPVTDVGASGVLECLDADYPIDPTFETPEEALEHALEVDAGNVPVPESVDDYEPVERSDGWIDFEFRESEDLHFTWGVIQDEDGRWGMASLGGCSPASR
jgi:hypothetical protein